QVGPDRVLPDVAARPLRRPGAVEADVRQRLIVILRVHHDPRSDLPHVRETRAHPCPLPRLREHRKQNRSQNGNNGYHDKQLDQRKPIPSTHHGSLLGPKIAAPPTTSSSANLNLLVRSVPRL